MRRLFLVFVCLFGLAAPAVAQDKPAEAINLDEFIAEQRPAMAGTRTIFVPHAISFSATVKSHPESIKVEYLYEAFAVMQVQPLPKVSHRMFIESREGRVIPVYVEDQVVSGIRSKSKLGGHVRFQGYHVYNYSKGPAIVIDAIL